MEKENEENVWRRRIFFVEEKKNGGGKLGKCMEKDMSPTREGRAGEEGTLEGRDEQFRDSSGDQRSLTLASRLF